MPSNNKKFISDAEMMELERKGVAKDASEPRKKKFISDKEMEELVKQGKAKDSNQTFGEFITPNAATPSAALEGFGKEATLGYLPQLQAMAAPQIYEVGNQINRARNLVTGSKLPTDIQPEGYLQERDANITRQKGYENTNPGSYYAGAGTGLLSSAGMLGMATPINAATKTARVGQAAKAGGLIGGLSNPGDEKGEINIVSPVHRAKNAITGLALGGLLQGGLERVFPKLAKAGIKEGPSEVLPPEDISSTIVQAPEMAQTRLENVLPPKSLNEIKSINETVKGSGKYNETPTHMELEKAVANVPDLEIKPTNLHYEATKNRTDRDILSLRKELPDEVGQELTKYEQSMKNELTKKTEDTIQKMGTGREKAQRFIESGDNFINDVKAKYESNKSNLEPAFKAFESANFPVQRYVPELRDAIVLDNPKMANILAIDEKGQIAIAPWNTKTGITKGAYSEISDVIKDLNSKNLSFRDLQNMRETMRQTINPNNAKEMAPISMMRKSMLNYMENLMASKLPGNQSVKNTFRDYAKNEQMIEKLESILGGKIDSFDETLLADPERVLGKVFSTHNNANVVSQIVGPDKMKDLIGDYLNLSLQKTKNMGNMSSNKVYTDLMKKMEVFEQYAPEEMNRIKSLLTISKIIPDAPSVNPSGTAKAMGILGSFKNAGKRTIMGSPMEGAKGLIGDAANAFNKSKSEKLALNDFNKILSGIVEPEKKGLMQKFDEKLSKSPQTQEELLNFLRMATTSSSPEDFKDSRDKRWSLIQKMIGNPNAIASPK